MLRAARLKPSAIPLAAQLRGVQLYPLMQGSDAGRGLLSVFGIPVLGVVVLAAEAMDYRFARGRLGRAGGSSAAFMGKQARARQRSRRLQVVRSGGEPGTAGDCRFDPGAAKRPADNGVESLELSAIRAERRISGAVAASRRSAVASPSLRGANE